MAIELSEHCWRICAAVASSFVSVTGTAPWVLDRTISMFGSYGALLPVGARDQRLVVLAVPVTCRGVLEPGYSAGGGWRDRDADGVGRDLLEAFQLHRAGEERGAVLLLPQVRGLTLVDRHVGLSIHAEQVIEVRADDAGRCGLRRSVSRACGRSA